MRIQKKKLMEEWNKWKIMCLQNKNEEHKEITILRYPPLCIPPSLYKISLN